MCEARGAPKTYTEIRALQGRPHERDAKKGASKEGRECTRTMTDMKQEKGDKGLTSEACNRVCACIRHLQRADKSFVWRVRASVGENKKSVV